MTVAEKKVIELADRVLEIISEGENRTDYNMQLQAIKTYLIGVKDGLDLANEMRLPDQSVQAKVGEERPLVGDGPHETTSGGPKRTTGTVDPKITVVREPNIQVDERDLPWNISSDLDRYSREL